MDVLTFYLDDTAPVISRRLSLQSGGDLDVIGGMSFRLLMRPLWSDVVTLDVAMDVDIATDELTYIPVTGDFDTEGVYRAWILVDYGGGKRQNTDEFQLNVFAHGPGQGAAVGAIYRAARALEPVSWDSLRNYPDYGDAELQRVIELAKARVLTTATPVAAEAVLDPRVVDFIAKKVLVDNVIYAAISFWSDQVVQQSARGNTDEVKTYPDRIRSLEEALKRYREDLDRQAGEVAELIGSISGAFDAPALLDGNATMLTPGLDEYPSHPVLTPRRWLYRR